MDWTEKYRPASLDAVIGNGPAVKKLRDWAEAWRTGIPAKRALILSGQPGVGKTTAALALAADMEWAVIELNASDARNAETIERVATAGALHQTFGDDGAFHSHTDEEAGRKLIILDEADNLYERAGADSGGTGATYSDRGGKVQIIKTIRETRQPILLIVNDLYALTKGSGSALNSLAETVKFSKVNVRSIPKLLEKIAKAEGVQVDRPVLEAIAEKASGDLRAAVRDLESMSAGREHVTVQHLASAGYRDHAGNIFDTVRHILKGKSGHQLRREVRDLDMTPADIVLWVDENLPKEFVHPEDLVRGYDRLSRADVFLGRVQRKQNYRLWAYASDLATLGVMTAHEHPGPSKFVPFGFPQWLSKMSRSRGTRATRDALAGRLAGATHASQRKIRDGTLAAFEAIFRADPEFAAHQMLRLELEDDQVAALLEERVTSKAVKDLRAAADALEEAGHRKPKDKPTGGLAAHMDEAPAAATPASGASESSAEDGQRKLF